MVLRELIDKTAKKLQWTTDDDKSRVKDFINIALRDIFYLYPEKLFKEDYFNCVAAYITGTIASVSGTTVTGTGTVWASAMADRKIRIGEGDTNYRYYKIASVTNGTSLELDETYAEGAVAAGTKYMIYQDEYNLPSDFWRPFVATVQTITLIRLNEWSLTTQMPYPERTNEDLPYYYNVNNHVDVPYSSSAVVSIKSSSASDTMIATIYGKVGGIKTSEALTLTGATAVDGSSTFTEIYSVVIATQGVGNITLHVGTGGTGATITTILPTKDLEADLVTRRRTIRLYPVPKDVYPVLVKYYRSIPVLNGDGEFVELLDETFDQYIIERAYIEGRFEDEDDEQASRREGRWLARINKKKNDDFMLDRQDMQETFGPPIGRYYDPSDPLLRQRGRRF